MQDNIIPAEVEINIKYKQLYNVSTEKFCPELRLGYFINGEERKVSISDFIQEVKSLLDHLSTLNYKKEE